MINISKMPKYDELIRKFPYLKDFLPFLDSLNKESERGAVLITASYIEEVLREILAAFMLPEKPVALLFDGYNAPLGSLSSRATAAYGLALITEPEFKECHVIRKIRNEFAHSHRSSFDDNRIIDLCANLQFRAMDYPDPTGGEVKVDPHGQFITAATSLIVILANRVHDVWPERRQPKE